jgi:transposase
MWAMPGPPGGHGNSTPAARLKGRAPIFVKALAAMSAQGMGASMSVEGATDGGAFQTYVEHFLLPTLKKGQVMVMDNLQSTRAREWGSWSRGVGVSVLFLLAYSPDFSPIEEAFSKIKGILRTIEAHTHEALMEVIGIALQAVSWQDALGWFGHCGYNITDQSLWKSL